MKFLSSGKAIGEELVELIEECKSMYVAVAWASAHHPCFKALISQA